MADGKVMGVSIVELVIGMVMLGVLLPIGIGNIAGFDLYSVTINGTSYGITDLVDGTIVTLVTFIMPIAYIAGLVIKAVRH